jgi:NPCBM/NEW2 domain
MQQKSVRMLSAWALGAIGLATACTFVWLGTLGTWVVPGTGLRGDAFDSLGQHLLHFDASVDQATIDWEGLTSGTRTVMYFEPFPALLRILPDLIVPGMYGLWSRASCLLAALLALAAAVAIARSALTVEGRRLDGPAWTYLAATTVGVGLGTPLAFLVSWPSIYHEAILWALCGSLWSVYFLLRVENRQIAPVRGVLGMAAAFAVTLLSRITFAIPIALALALVTAKVLASTTRGARRGRGVAIVAMALSPAVLATAFHFWYSYERFGSVLSFSHISEYVHYAEIGGIFNLHRIPSALDNYFAPARYCLASHFPLFRLAPVHYTDPSIFFEWKEETLPLTLGSSWLLLGGALGALALLRRPRRPSMIAVALFLALQGVLIASFYFVTERYASEFMPLLLFLFSAHLASPPRSALARRVLPPLLFALALVSAVVTVGATLQWNQAVNEDVSFEDKVRLAHLLYPQGGPPVGQASAVPLGDLQPVAQVASFAPLRRNTTWDGLPIVFAGVYYPTGLGMHAIGRATYAVPPRATAFWSVIGLPDSAVRCEKGSVVFELRDQDDKVLYRSRTIRTGDDPVHVMVPLHGVRSLALVVGDAGDGRDCDHAAWGAPSFILGPRMGSAR